MKILHTADWHIGKKLHKHELSEDFELFIDWLCKCIEEEQVEVLLVSGDIFDLANPSSEARSQYFRALMKLQKLHCKIILTGGNHDSPAMLNAPKDLMRELDMHVIGGLPENLEDAIIPIHKNNEPQLVVAAIPYLRDADLRQATDGHSYEDKLEAIRSGIKNTFLEAAQICQTKYPNIPTIAMGHLFAAGMQNSESERDIQIGNQAAFEAHQFGDYFNYIALGHIHKPQRVSAAVPTFYSGSPLPLSFSERKDEKRILILETENSWEPKNIQVPVFRKLKRITGPLDSLKQKLKALTEHFELESLVEVKLEEENYDALKIYELDNLVSQFEKPGYKIVKHRAHFNNQVKGAAELYQQNKQLEDLKPREVFTELIAKHEYDQETQQELLTAFDEILEEVQQTQSL